MSPQEAAFSTRPHSELERDTRIVLTFLEEARLVLVRKGGSGQAVLCTLKEPSKVS